MLPGAAAVAAAAAASAVGVCGACIGVRMRVPSLLLLQCILVQQRCIEREPSLQSVHRLRCTSADATHVCTNFPGSKRAEEHHQERQAAKSGFLIRERPGVAGSQPGRARGRASEHEGSNEKGEVEEEGRGSHTL